MNVRSIQTICMASVAVNVTLIAGFAVFGCRLLPAEPPPPDAGAQSRLATKRAGTSRVIRANGIPDHPTGTFPNAGNPNTIRPQRYHFRVPADPQVADEITPLGLHPFGIALNGVVFDPGSARFWNHDRRSGWQYEPMSPAVHMGLDHNHAHVQPSGAYHYHGLPRGLVQVLAERQQATGKRRMLLVGHAADGFPIYAEYGYDEPLDAASGLRPVRSSYRLRKGARPGGPPGRFDGTFVQDYEYVAGAGDLDECNGRFGVTPEYPEGIYHYYLTREFPFVPRAFRGTPDPSFLR